MKTMKYNRLKKILLATLATTLFFPRVDAAEDVQPEGTSNNKITVNAGKPPYYTIERNPTTEEKEALHLTEEESSSTVYLEEDTYGNIYGGGGEENSEEVTNNDITVNGGTINGVFGGMSSSGNVWGNTITIKDGTISGISGGEVAYVSSGGTSSSFDNFTGGNVYKNSVTINNGTINGYIVGGSSLTGKAYDNTININGGTIVGNIIGGEVQNSTDNSAVYGNTINISGTPDLSRANLFGGLLAGEGNDGSENGSYNTLNVNSAGLTVQSIDIDSFGKLNFLVPEGFVSGGNILTVTNGISLSSSDDLSKFNFNVHGNSGLKKDDTINLIFNGTASSADTLEDYMNNVDGTTTDGSYNTTMTNGITGIYAATLTNTEDALWRRLAIILVRTVKALRFQRNKRMLLKP